MNFTVQREFELSHISAKASTLNQCTMKTTNVTVVYFLVSEEIKARISIWFVLHKNIAFSIKYVLEKVFLKPLQHSPVAKVHIPPGTRPYWTVIRSVTHGAIPSLSPSLVFPISHATRSASDALPTTSPSSRPVLVVQVDVRCLVGGWPSKTLSAFTSC